nr:MAG TPA: hypothetical protein [Caudoviricetes sp.]
MRLLCGNAIVAERQSGQTLDGTDRRQKKSPSGNDGRNVAVLNHVKGF